MNAAEMNTEQQTSKAATILFWLVAGSLVLSLALFKAIPKRAEAASNECFAKIQTLGSLAKAFAGKHQGRRPNSIEDFRELVPNMTPQTWACPSNTNAQYQFTPTQSDDAIGDDVLVKCLIHGHFVTAQGDAVKSRKPKGNERHLNIGLIPFFSLHPRAVAATDVLSEALVLA
jgi:hypothetical protein